MKTTLRILPAIVISQFCCTSLWFAGNAVLNDLMREFDIDRMGLGHLTAAVQFGFISGTLIFAILTIADRYSPSKVFLFCAVSGALFNLIMLLDQNSLISLATSRFMVGFSLAGVYPVGMKIASDHFDKGLGKSLGYLVGALVLGTAFPHLVKVITVDSSLPWRWVVILTSVLSLMGGILLFSLVGDGPYRKVSKGFHLNAFFKVFASGSFRTAAFGYFGHMWELYAFWAFIPFLLEYRNLSIPGSDLNVPLLSFIIIAVGGLACVIGVYIAREKRVKKVARTALLISCCCCLLSPFMLQIPSNTIFLVFLICWGMAVIADSPLFSTLVAKNAIAEYRGTALTIVNCIGFAITIVSIQTLNLLQETINPQYLLIFLAFGPVLGLYVLFRK
ncbi:MFS transporter [Robertkochia solimangrovi]|uniref:MFS transporter n=1 Tax=Robertkochia solimangrovi TaxID=2213046 RepID=UPI0011800EEB|nr:MFS transporter [Robertkochia solimangrovi]TRZ42558.1 MFS transporter [Robertkochia solimangrovi]